MDASRTNRSLDTSLSGDGWLACSRTTPSLACSPNRTGSELRCSEPIRKKSQYLEISSMTPPPQDVLHRVEALFMARSNDQMQIRIFLSQFCICIEHEFFFAGHGAGRDPYPWPCTKKFCEL